MAGQADWIHGKVVLITGSASGRGAATAASLHRRGARLVLTDIDGAGAERTARALAGAGAGADSRAPSGAGSRPVALAADVTRLADMHSAVREAVAHFGRLDVVWANAGVAASFGPLAGADPAAWVRTIEVNLIGAFYTVQAALPEVMRQRGHVAVTASLASFVNAPCMSAYSATKSGVEAMCNSLRQELAHHGVTVGAIHPSWVATPLVGHGETWSAFRRLRAAMPKPLARDMPVAEAAERIAQGIAARRDRVYLPGFVRFIRWLRTPLHSVLGERDLRRAMPAVEEAFAQDVAAAAAAAASTAGAAPPAAAARAEALG